MGHAELLGLPLTRLDGESRVVELMQQAWSKNRSLLVTFVNPHAWTTVRRDTTYAPLLGEMDLVLPDGIAVARVASMLLGGGCARMSFDASSLYHPVFEALNDGGKRLFVIGAAPGVALAATERMQDAYPEIGIVGCLDGFTEREEAVRLILAANPDMVLCGMGAPHQERLVLALREAGYRGVAFTCGGFLDQLAHAEAYYPGWVDRLELRWAWRIWKEPRRLWRRYAIEYLPFIRASLVGLARRFVLGRTVHDESAGLPARALDHG